MIPTQAIFFYIDFPIKCQFNVQIHLFRRYFLFLYKKIVFTIHFL